MSFPFTLTRDEEFLDIFFDELALPNLVKRQLAKVEEYKRVRAGFTSTGVPTNINLTRTMRGAAGRRIAIGGPYAAKLREMKTALERAAAVEAPTTTRKSSSCAATSPSCGRRWRRFPSSTPLTCATTTGSAFRSRRRRR